MVFPLMNATGRIATAPAGHEPPGRGSQTVFGNHWTPLPVTAAVREKVIGAPTSGRKVLARPVNELLFAAGIPPARAPALPANSVTGLPLCDWTIAESCQPSTSWFPWNGTS